MTAEFVEAAGSALLSVRDITKIFPGVRALDHVSAENIFMDRIPSPCPGRGRRPAPGPAGAPARGPNPSGRGAVNSQSPNRDSSSLAPWMIRRTWTTPSWTR